MPLADIPFYVFSLITINALLLFISTGYSLLVKINLSQDTQHMQRWGMSMPEFIWRGIVSVELGRGDVG